MTPSEKGVVFRAVAGGGVEAVGKIGVGVGEGGIVADTPQLL